MRIGSHVDRDDPLRHAVDRGADVVQFFLTDPQGWTRPGPSDDAEALIASPTDVYVHAPYVINIASPNNRIRIPSRKLLQAHATAAAVVGARGLVVHAGQVGKTGDLDAGLASWRKTFAYAAESGGFSTRILVENTAGGSGSCARRLDSLARLWDTIGDYDVGFCLDTCHAYCGGEELSTIVDRVKSITGTIDLIHANNTRDAFGSGRDRHANLAEGSIDPDLITAVVRSADAPVIVETPGGLAGQRADIAFLRQRTV